MLQLNRTLLGCFGVWGETAGYRDALASKEDFDITQSKIKLFNIWDEQIVVLRNKNIQDVQ